MVVPAFGWSAGDIVESVKLITRVCQAFKDSGGAAEKYKTSAEFLEGFKRTLESLDEYAKTRAGERYADDIAAQVKIIEQPWKKFEEFLATFSNALGSKNAKSRLTRAMKTVKWTLNDLSGEVDKLKRAVLQPQQVINHLLSLAIIKHVEEQGSAPFNPSQCQQLKHAVELAGVESQLRELLQVAQQLMSSGNSWEISLLPEIKDPLESLHIARETDIKVLRKELRERSVCPNVFEGNASTVPPMNFLEYVHSCKESMLDSSQTTTTEEQEEQQMRLMELEIELEQRIKELQDLSTEKSSCIDKLRGTLTTICVSHFALLIFTCMVGGLHHSNVRRVQDSSSHHNFYVPLTTKTTYSTATLETRKTRMLAHPSGPPEMRVPYSEINDKDAEVTNRKIESWTWEDKWLQKHGKDSNASKVRDSIPLNPCPPRHEAITKTPSFYFWFREMEQTPGRERNEGQAHWLPPVRQGDNRVSTRGGIPKDGLWFACNGQSIRREERPPDPEIVAQLFGTSSVYINKQVFYIINYDATLYPVGDTTIDSEAFPQPRASEAAWANWTRLAFNGVGSYSYATIYGGHDRLLMQCSKQTWLNVLLPSAFHAKAPAATQDIAKDSLNGDLSILLSLVAHSVEPTNVELALTQWFRDGVWTVSNSFPSGHNQDKRGVIVSVYPAPGVRPEQLTKYGEGEYGPIFQ